MRRPFQNAVKGGCEAGNEGGGGGVEAVERGKAAGEVCRRGAHSARVFHDIADHLADAPAQVGESAVVRYAALWEDVEPVAVRAEAAGDDLQVGLVEALPSLDGQHLARPEKGSASVEGLLRLSWV